MLCFSCLAHALTAEAYIVIDADRGVLLEKNADSVRSIASITKLITARAAIDQDQETLIRILPEDLKLGHMRRTPLRAGGLYTRHELIELTLVSSDNVAAIALGRYATSPIFLPENTRYVEASGLDAGNVSTAREIAEFAQGLLATPLAGISTHSHAAIGNTERGSTNPLILNPRWNFLLSKTGFINRSGGCLVTIISTGERQLTFVVLGSRSIPDRWRDLQELRRMVDETAPPDQVVTRAKRYKVARHHSAR
jgi:D-alanyl-D-alanine endopeptidase (penicillin-binding protein 7)